TMVALLSGAAGAQEPQQAAMVLNVSVRDQYRLEAPPSLERIHVVDPEVADVVLERPGSGRKGQILIVGKKPGVTIVSLWRKGEAEAQHYQVRVRSSLAALLPDQGFGARTQVLGDAAVISGEAPSLLAHHVVRAGADAEVGEEAVLDLSTIATPGTVQVEVKVVEFNKQSLKQAGFNFSATNTRGSFSFGTAGQFAPSTGSLFDLALGLTRGNFLFNTQLSLLESHGMARVLAEPTLVALSGQSAKFL